MSNEYSFWGVQKAGLIFLKENFMLILKRLGVPLFGMLFGLYVVFTQSYMVMAKVLSSGQSASKASILINIVLASVLVVVATWKVLLVCLEILYSLKDGEKVDDLTVYIPKVKENEKKFMRAIGKLALCYFYFTIPYFVAIFVMALAALFGQPLYGLYVLVPLVYIYPILFLVLIWFMVKTFLILQIFAMEDELEPKEIIKRCFKVADKKNFWFTFGLLAVLSIISLAPLFVPLTKVVLSFVVTYVVMYLLIVVYLVAGFYTYKKFTTQEV